MSYNENVKIIAFVGLAGSGKTTAVEYVSTKGFPKVNAGNVEQINNLINAGQHNIVDDSLLNWNQYKAMKEEFHSTLILIAVVASRHLRHHRLAIRTESPLTEAEATARDWQEIEQGQISGPIAIAEHFILNDGSEDELYTKINSLLDELEFRV